MPTIADFDNEKLQVNLDFQLIKKVFTVLELFKNATTMLSSGDATRSHRT